MGKRYEYRYEETSNHTPLVIIMIISRSLPAKTTKYFSIILNIVDLQDEDDSVFTTNMLEGKEPSSRHVIHQSLSEISIPFKFYFSTLVSYSISACISLHSLPEGFSVVNTSNQMSVNNGIVEMLISEEEDGQFVIVNPPKLTVCT